MEGSEVGLTGQILEVEQEELEMEREEKRE